MEKPKAEPADITVAQRHFSVKAIGGTRQLFAEKAGLTDPTIGKWLKGEPISAESEGKIIETVRREGWRFHSGGIVRLAR